MSAKLDEQTARLLDATRDASFNLWNALLTVNGLFISVFSIIAVFDPEFRVVSSGLVVVCIVTSGLLIQNYRDIKGLYKYIGQLTEDAFSQMSPEEIHRKESEAPDAHRFESREDWVIRLLFLEAVLIVVLLLLKLDLIPGK